MVWCAWSNNFDLSFQRLPVKKPDPLVACLTTPEDRLPLLFDNYIERRLSVFDCLVVPHTRSYFDHQKFMRRPEIIEIIERQETPMVNWSVIEGVYKEYGDNDKLFRFCRALKNNYYPIHGTTWAVSHRRYEDKKEVMKENNYKIEPWFFKLRWEVPEKITGIIPEINLSQAKEFQLTCPDHVLQRKMCSVTFKFATFARKPEDLNGILTVQFLDGSRNPLATFTRECYKFADNEDYCFDFPSMISPKFVRFSSTSTPGHGITLWIVKEDEPYMKVVYEYR